MGILATPLGWLMKGCYAIVKNYGLALLLFTVITRLITLPLQVKQQKSTARMTMIQPEIEKLKQKYGKNQEKLNEETMRLYSENHINPMASCLPMIVTLVLLWALIPVVYGPLSYISSAEKDIVKQDCQTVTQLYTISAEVKSKDTDIAALVEKASENEDGAVAGLDEILSDKKTYPDSKKVLDKLSDAEKEDLLEKFVEFEGLDKFLLNPDNFTQNMMRSAYGPEVLLFNFKKADGQYMGVLDSDVQAAINDFDYTFFGMELGKIPTKKDATVLIPFISFFLQLATTIISQIFSKKNNPDMKMNGSMMVMLFTMPLISLWIGFKFPCALGIYWIYSSFIGIIQVIFLNVIYSPAKVKVMVQKDLEKAKAKRKKNGPSFMERALEIRNEQGENAPTLKEAQKKAQRKYAVDDEEDVKLSKSQQKELERQKLNEARRRYAEKYGDTYTED